VIVADASILVGALLRAEPGLAERVVLNSGQIHAPYLVDIEVMSAVRKLANSGQISVRRAEEAVRDFQDLPLTLYPHALLLSRVWELRANLTAYDAAYVALAELLEAPLVTRDQRLANAPGHMARIEIL
jgi:predicted nucleic acid-binding protein